MAAAGPPPPPWREGGRSTGPVRWLSQTRSRGGRQRAAEARPCAEASDSDLEQGEGERGLPAVGVESECFVEALLGTHLRHAHTHMGLSDARCVGMVRIQIRSRGIATRRRRYFGREGPSEPARGRMKDGGGGRRPSRLARRGGQPASRGSAGGGAPAVDPATFQQQTRATYRRAPFTAALANSNSIARAPDRRSTRLSP